MHDHLQWPDHAAHRVGERVMTGTAIEQARSVEVADGVHAYVQPDGSWMINNTGLVVGATGAVVVDTCATERRTRAQLDAIRRTTDVPVRTVVNTHSHPDHTNGNYLFPQAAVVAHTKCRTGLLVKPPEVEGVWPPIDFGDLQPRLPDVTYTDRLTVWAGDLEVQLIHPGRTAHTTGDTIVWVPDRGVLFAGDLVFAGGTPFALGGSLTGWIDTLETVVRPLPVRALVPGHGEPGGLELIEPVIGYLRFVRDAAARAHAAGLTPLEAARELDLGEFAELLDPERIVGNLYRAYAELGDPFNPRAAFTDMIAFNGGQPLHCCV